jgi:hypothetical protein
MGNRAVFRLHRQSRWRGGSRRGSWRRQSSCGSGSRRPGGPRIDPLGPGGGRLAAAGSPAAAAGCPSSVAEISYPIFIFNFVLFYHIFWAPQQRNSKTHMST